MPFARYVAQNGIANIKRYHIAKVGALASTSLRISYHSLPCALLITSCAVANTSLWDFCKTKSRQPLTPLHHTYSLCPPAALAEGVLGSSTPPHGCLAASSGRAGMPSSFSLLLSCPDAVVANNL